MQKNKIKFKARNIENTVKANIAPLYQQINCKCVERATGRPNSNGITLVAVVITIIVMLLLIGVTVSTVLKGNLFNIAKKASVETRASMVEEKVAEWKSNKKIDEYLEENSNTQSLEELLNDLETQQLITSEERKEIEENMEVKIGDKEILFYELPEGYTRLEYLESTGTQYIDLGFTIKYDYIVTCDLLVTKFDNYFWATGGIYGSCAVSNGQKAYNLILSNSNELYYRNSSSSEAIKSSPIELNKKYRTTTNFNNLTVNNEIYIGEFDYNYKNPFTSYLFARNKGGNAEYFLHGYIYKFKIYDQQGNDVLDFIPCLDTNEIPCMYDTVTGKTFYNQGTGEFLYGEIEQ